jgi:hypothetical protein
MIHDGSATYILCKFCDMLLAGRDQFIGHLFHNHDLPYEELDIIWRSICPEI